MLFRPMFRRFGLSLILLSVTAAANAAVYEIDPSHTQVHFDYNHFGFSNISGRFDHVQGEFDFDPADPARSKVSIQIPVNSISTGVDRLDQHLLSEDFFDAHKFPEARFVSERVEVREDGRLQVFGQLEIHGVSKPVAFDVRINKIGEHPMKKRPAAGFDATLSLRRSEFGLGAYAPAVSDEVTLRITLEAVQAE